jgi:DNA-binding transcriptional MerR regulator
MQRLPEKVNLQQQQLNEFQDQCLENIHTDSEILQTLRHFAAQSGGINGVITVTHPTRTYIKYLRGHGIKLKTNKPIIDYLPFADVVKTTQQSLNAKLSSILSHYEQMSPELKKTTFLFRFQLPYSHNPTQSLQNYMFVENLNIFSQSNVTSNMDDEDEHKEDPSSKMRPKRLNRENLNRLFH